LEKKEQNKIFLAIQDPKYAKKEKAKADEKWKNLLRLAQQKNPNLREPTLPYSEAHIVG